MRWLSFPELVPRIVSWHTVVSWLACSSRATSSPTRSCNTAPLPLHRHGLHQVLRCVLVEPEARDGLLLPGRGLLQELLPVDLVPAVHPVRGGGDAGDRVPRPAERPRHGRRPRAVVDRVVRVARVEHGVVQALAHGGAPRAATGLRAGALARPAGATRRRASTKASSCKLPVEAACAALPTVLDVNPVGLWV